MCSILFQLEDEHSKRWPTPARRAMGHAFARLENIKYAAWYCVEAKVVLINVPKRSMSKQLVFNSERRKASSTISLIKRSGLPLVVFYGATLVLRIDEQGEAHLVGVLGRYLGVSRQLFRRAGQ